MTHRFFIAEPVGDVGFVGAKSRLESGEVAAGAGISCVDDIYILTVKASSIRVSCDPNCVFCVLPINRTVLTFGDEHALASPYSHHCHVSPDVVEGVALVQDDLVLAAHLPVVLDPRIGVLVLVLICR